MAGYSLFDNIRTQLEVQNMKVKEERGKWRAHISHTGDNTREMACTYKSYRR
jgi:hypothetical protein